MQDELSKLIGLTRRLGKSRQMRERDGFGDGKIRRKGEALRRGEDLWSYSEE
jgi:hypothetical protein